MNAHRRIVRALNLDDGESSRMVERRRRGEAGVAFCFLELGGAGVVVTERGSGYECHRGSAA